MLPKDERSFGWHTRYVRAFHRSWEGAGLVDNKQFTPSSLIQTACLVYVVEDHKRRMAQVFS